MLYLQVNKTPLERNRGRRQCRLELTASSKFLLNFQLNSVRDNTERSLPLQKEIEHLVCHFIKDIDSKIL